MENLTKALLKVMAECKGLDKSLQVGKGQNAYKGVADKDVKLLVGQSLQKNGLVLLPIGVEDDLKIERWEEADPWSKSTPKDVKVKQSVFTSVKTRYLLAHESGESIELVGYGHGVDTQDKSAGKATTYALKNLLLYIALVPTGHIDDTDTTHSNEHDNPKKTTKPVKQHSDPVKNATVNIDDNPTFIQGIKDMNDCKTLAELQTTWTKYKSLQKEPKFIEYKDVCKKRLS